MKKVLPVVLIFLAMAHVGGVMPFYFYALQEVKTEMNLELASESGLQKVVVSAEEYNNPNVFQKEEESEFRYMGKMYDFKTMVKEGNNFVFYALEDNKETTLIDFLKSAFEQPDSSAKNTRSPISNLFKNLDKDFIVEMQKDFDIQLPENSFWLFQIATKACTGYLTVLFSPPDFQ